MAYVLQADGGLMELRGGLAADVEIGQSRLDAAETTVAHLSCPPQFLADPRKSSRANKNPASASGLLDWRSSPFTPPRPFFTYCNLPPVLSSSPLPVISGAP